MEAYVIIYCQLRIKGDDVHIQVRDDAVQMNRPYGLALNAELHEDEFLWGCAQRDYNCAPWQKSLASDSLTYAEGRLRVYDFNSPKELQVHIDDTNAWYDCWINTPKQERLLREYICKLFEYKET